MDEPLKPCPFDVGDRDHRLAVQTTKDCCHAIRVTCSCGAEGPYVEGHNRNSAIAAWNTRRAGESQ